MSAHEPLPFALASCGCPPHAELLTSLADAFGAVDAEALDRSLDDMARAVPIPPAPDPVAELAAVADLWQTGAMPGCGDLEWPVQCDDLMIDRALTERAAHPLVQATVAAEAGRRCGFPLSVVSNGEDHCVAHVRLDAPLVVRVPDGEVMDGNDLAPTLRWRCAHEVCGLVLDEMEERLVRGGNLSDAMKAAELRMHLPVDERGEEKVQHQLAGMRARLN